MTKYNRRKFLGAGALIGLGLSTNAMFTKNKKRKMVIHHVFFWLKNPESVEDRDKLVEGVKTLGRIETIRKIHVGVPASTEKRDVVDTSWHVSELMFFDDEAGQKVYQDHPIHLEFIKNYGHLWNKVVVYDADEA